MSTTDETQVSRAVVELAARHLDVSPEEAAVDIVSGDASTRRYFRVRGGGRSVVVAIYTEPFDERERARDRLRRQEAASPTARLTYANDPCAHIEMTALFLQAGLPVPRVLAAAGADAALLFEDVGDLRLQDWLADHSAEQKRAEYRRAVDLIVRIQEVTGRAEQTDSISAHLAFDEMKLRWELSHFFANYFNRYLTVRVDGPTNLAVQQEFKALCADLAGRPQVLTHRDFHARNLMVRDGDLFIIDHQDARMGPASYDLASLLDDPYARLDRGLAAEMVEYFIERKSEAGAALSDVAAFREELRLMTVQRMLKAVGTYAYQAAVAHNPVYVGYIEPALDRALDAMRETGRMPATEALLEKTRRRD